MQIFIGADHRGYEWKNTLSKRLTECPDGEGKIDLYDLGPTSYDPDDDFNDTAMAVAKAVRENEGARGILICGSGDGMCIQANRFRKVRAARCSSAEEARIAREHDNINVLCLAADILDDQLLEQIVRAFLGTEFDEQNINRMRRIARLDEENYA